jgi:hypothetical protein
VQAADVNRSTKKCTGYRHSAFIVRLPPPPHMQLLFNFTSLKLLVYNSRLHSLYSTSKINYIQNNVLVLNKGEDASDSRKLDVLTSWSPVAKPKSCPHYSVFVTIVFSRTSYPVKYFRMPPKISSSTPS